MNAGEDVKLVAMADLFEDRLVPARARLKELSPNQVQVDDDHLFHGFDGYKKVMESDRFHNFLKKSIMQPFWMSSVEYGKFLEKTNNQWKVWLGEIDLLKKK